MGIGLTCYSVSAMKTLFALLQEELFPLIASLPRNEVELVRAAIDGGADALKVHLNCEHRASGTRFGAFAEERESLEAIAGLAREAGCALGVMPGSDTFASLQELQALAGMGFEFLDSYAGDLPASLLTVRPLRTMVALPPDHDVMEARALRRIGADALEASIVPPDQYGQDLTAGDLLKYAALAGASRLPVIVPTQKKVQPEDLPALRASGVSSLMVGAIVTGTTAESISESLSRFRSARDQ